MADLEQLKLASRWQRLGASLVDVLVALAVVIPIVAVMYGTGGLQEIAQNGKLSIGQNLFGSLFGFGAFLAINGSLLAKHGQTVGKRAVGIRIVSCKSGKLVPLSKIIFLRMLPFFLISKIPVLGKILPLLDILFIFGAEKRCIHDMIAGTVVLRTEPVERYWTPNSERGR